MQHFRIEDDAVVEALRQNGFTCEKPKAQLIPGAIHFFTRSVEEEQAAEQASRWYDTNCPVRFGEPYTLPDGRVLVSRGTSLVLGEQR